MCKSSVFFLLSIFFIINLTACVNTPETETPISIFRAKNIHDKNLSGLYIYRPPAMANRFYSTNIIIDNNNALPIKPGQLKHLNLKPGQHQISLLAADEFKGKHKLRLIFYARKNYYLRIKTTLNLSTDSNYKPYKRTFNLQRVNKTTAIAQINKCCYSEKVPNKTKAVETKSNNVQENKKAVFSVDRTSDPFSHKSP